MFRNYSNYQNNEECDSFGEELNQFYCVKKAYASGIQIEN